MCRKKYLPRTCHRFKYPHDFFNIFPKQNPNCKEARFPVSAKPHTKLYWWAAAGISSLSLATGSKIHPVVVCITIYIKESTTCACSCVRATWINSLVRLLLYYDLTFTHTFVCIYVCVCKYTLLWSNCGCSGCFHDFLSCTNTRAHTYTGIRRSRLYTSETFDIITRAHTHELALAEWELYIHAFVVIRCAVKTLSRMLSSVYTCVVVPRKQRVFFLSVSSECGLSSVSVGCCVCVVDSDLHGRKIPLFEYEEKICCCFCDLRIVRPKLHCLRSHMLASLVFSWWCWRWWWPNYRI